MLEEGYAAVSIRRVAKAANVSSTLLHYYYSTADDLLIALYRHNSEKDLVQLRSALDAPDQPLTSAELGDAIQRAISGLPEKQRLALIMFAVEKMPQKDVAEVLNCSVEAVKWHVFMARKHLRKCLGSHL